MSGIPPYPEGVNEERYSGQWPSVEELPDTCDFCGSRNLMIEVDERRGDSLQFCSWGCVMDYAIRKVNALLPYTKEGKDSPEASTNS